MKTVRYLIIAFLLVAVAGPSVFAQQPGPDQAGMQRAPQGSLSGRVVEEATAAPIASATVGIWRKSDSTIETGAITDADGRFRIEGLRGGAFYARISFVGFESYIMDDIILSPQQADVDLGTVRLIESTQMMEEVEVAADRDFMEVGIDRTVYNTRDQLVSAGGTATDVLQNIPSVEVDIDGNISLRGNQNVAVLINGRPASMQGEALTSFLQGLPAHMIERIEVVPNPSAKYEPDGMAGILNIVLRQDRDLGWGGSVSSSAETNGNLGGSVNATYQRGKIGLTTGYSFRTGTRDVEGWRFRENRFRTPLTYLDQDNLGDNGMTSHNVNASIDYRLADKNTLTLSSMLSHRGGTGDELTSYLELDDARATTARWDRRSRGDRNDLSSDLRLSFSRIIDPSKHELTAEVRLENEWEDDADRFTQRVFTPFDAAVAEITQQQANEQNDENLELSAQLDYTRPFGGSGKIETGYKGSLEKLASDFFSETFDPAAGIWTPDATVNNTFEYDIQIHAAYGIVGTQLGKFGLQGGVRLEQAMTDFDLKTTRETFENDYFSVFPSAYLTYEISEAQRFKVSYSKRINRPRTGGWFNMLNPFDRNDDPLFRRVGNPRLKPEYVHAYEASYTRFLGTASLTLAPYFNRTVDVIRIYESVDQNGVSTTTFENFDTSDSWGLEAIGTVRLGSRLNAFVSFNAFKVVTDGSNVDADMTNNALGWMSRANATLNVRPGLDLQASYFYRAPMDVEGGRMSSRSMADLALRQKFLSDKASLSLRMSDVFNTMGFHMTREDEMFFQEFDRKWDAQRVGLTFTYNFGQSERQRRRGQEPSEREGGAGDEIQMQMQ